MIGDLFRVTGNGGQLMGVIALLASALRLSQQKFGGSSFAAPSRSRPPRASGTICRALLVYTRGWKHAQQKQLFAVAKGATASSCNIAHQAAWQHNRNPSRRWFGGYRFYA
jgi:hypothetical protein